jgi:hypothetical protein
MLAPREWATSATCRTVAKLKQTRKLHEVLKMSGDNVSSYAGRCLRFVMASIIAAALIGCDTASSPYRDPPSAGKPTPGTEGAPTIVAVSPATSVYIFQGQPVAISWIDSDGDDNATVTVFYDEDGAADTGDEVILDIRPEDPDGLGDQFTWNTTGVQGGTKRLVVKK